MNWSSHRGKELGFLFLLFLQPSAAVGTLKVSNINWTHNKKERSIFSFEKEHANWYGYRENKNLVVGKERGEKANRCWEASIHSFIQQIFTDHLQGSRPWGTEQWRKQSPTFMRQDCAKDWFNVLTLQGSVWLFPLRGAPSGNFTTSPRLAALGPLGLWAGSSLYYCSVISQLSGRELLVVNVCLLTRLQVPCRLASLGPAVLPKRTKLLDLRESTKRSTAELISEQRYKVVFTFFCFKYTQTHIHMQLLLWQLQPR